MAVRKLSTPGKILLGILMLMGWAGWAIFISGFAHFADTSRFYTRRSYGSHILFLVVSGIQLILLFIYILRPRNTLGLVCLVGCLFGGFTAGLTLDKDGSTRELGFRDNRNSVVIPCHNEGGLPHDACRDIELDIAGATVYALASVLISLALMVYAHSRCTPSRNLLLKVAFFFMVVGGIIFYAGFLQFVRRHHDKSKVPDAGIHEGHRVPRQYEIGEWTSVVVFSIGAGVVLVVVAATLALVKELIFLFSLVCVQICGIFSGGGFHYMARILDSGFRTEIWPPITCDGLDGACRMIAAAEAGLIIFFIGLIIYLIGLYAALTGDIELGQLDSQAYFNGVDWFALYPRKAPIHGTAV
eukprot:TRINITY_DN137_c0_g1_i1.p1 TRINITY_DN137_c0_g1~~TRINITY_DN137_c0_g1_i1.p1  ORF type:complete len:357 (-),score=77.42 TRINITY_DN137_c0_g1_i1:200-1270(-)